MRSEEPREWRRVVLGEVVTLKRGYDLPARLRVAGDVPIVSSSGRSGTHNEYKVLGPGVVTGRYGTIGRVFYIAEPFWPLNTALYVEDFLGNDPRYCAELLRTINYSAHDGKSGVPGINRNDLHQEPVCVPPLDEQRRIASVLGGLDDKIESNRRLSNTLHAVVSLHFEHTFDGAGSQIMGRLADLVSITMGQSPPGSTYTEDVDAGPCLVQGMGAFGERFPVSDVYTSAPRKMAPAGATLMTVRAPVGAVNVADTEICLGRGVAALEGPAPTYVEFLTRSLAGRWSSEESGTIFPAVNAKQIAELAVPIPAQEAIDIFEMTARPMAEQLLSLYREAGSLASIRDELLPRLVSGRLRVPDTKGLGKVSEPAVEGLDAGSAAED